MKRQPVTLREDSEQPDLERRSFLGRLAGLALLAGGFGNALTTSPARAATTVIGGSVGLELNGAFAGYLHSAAGGEPVFEVSALPTGTPTADKSVAARHPTPLEFGISAGISPSLSKWIGSFGQDMGAMQSGALVQFDSSGYPVRRLTFNDATIVGIAAPPLDNSTPAPIAITVTILPQSSSIGSVSNGPSAPSLRTAGTNLSSVFRLQIQGLENVTANALRIEGVGAKLVSGPRETFVDAGSLRVTLPTTSAEPFFQWFEQCSNRNCVERPGIIQLMTRDGTRQIATVELVNLGIVRVAPSWSVGTGSPATVTVDLYCEQQRFNFDGMATA